MSVFDHVGSGFESGHSETFGSDEDVIVNIHHESPPVLPVFLDDIPCLYDEFGEVSPGWSKLFDGWIAAMGHLLPKSFKQLECLTTQEHSYSLSWSENDNTTSNQINRVPVIVTSKRWEYECTQCNAKILGGIRRFEAHVRNAHQLQCVCGKEFNSKLGLEYHIHMEERAEQFASHAIFTNAGPQVKHALIRQKSKGRVPLECDFCDEVFTNRAIAVKHRKALHAHLIDLSNNNTNKSPLPRILKKRERRDRKFERRVGRSKKIKIETVVTDVPSQQGGIDFPIIDTERLAVSTVSSYQEIFCDNGGGTVLINHIG